MGFFPTWDFVLMGFYPDTASGRSPAGKLILVVGRLLETKHANVFQIISIRVSSHFPFYDMNIAYSVN